MTFKKGDVLVATAPNGLHVQSWPRHRGRWFLIHVAQGERALFLGFDKEPSVIQDTHREQRIMKLLLYRGQMAHMRDVWLEPLDTFERMWLKV